LYDECPTSLRMHFDRSAFRSLAGPIAWSAGQGRTAQRRRNSMQPLIRPWRDWAMRNLWPMHRNSPQPQALHYRYEKAGLTLHDHPVPWDAEAVVIEALLFLPEPVARRKGDFQLRLPGQGPVAPESLRRQEGDGRYRLIF